MKIKEVCRRTGLSDRTVRFYMEEKLIAPSFTENYLGRKAFDFSEEDVLALQDIAILRKFGFSVGQIRRLLEDPGSSAVILPEIRQSKQKTIESEQEALAALNRLDGAKAYGVSELAKALAAPATEHTLPAEDQKERLPRRKLLRSLAAFALCLLPSLLPWFWFNFDISCWRGIGLMRQPLQLGCLLMVFMLFCGTERHAVFLRLAGTALVCVDYVLCYLHFPERANLAGGMDLALSSRAVHWTYWAACAVILGYLIYALTESIRILMKKE